MNLESYKILFFSKLKNKKFLLSDIPTSYYKNTEKLSDKYLMQSFIIDSLKEENSQQSDAKILINKLHQKNKINVMKKLINVNQIEIISKTFLSENINHCFLKGSAIAYCLNSEYAKNRFSRDIDVLVEKKDIEKAYVLLKGLGYKYKDKLVADNAKFHNHRHHIPALVNEIGAIVEIHSRITKKEHYDICPLTNHSLKNKIKFCSGDKEIHIYNKESMIVHLLYHAALHHRYNFGPLFIYDIQAILKSNAINKSQLKHLLNACHLEQEFDSLISFLNSKDNDVYLKKLHEHISVLEKKFSLKNFLNKVRIHKDAYQTGIFSWRYYFALIVVFYKYIKK